MTESDLDPSANGRLFFRSGILRAERRQRAAPRPAPREAALAEAGREVPVHAECDVLVVGGGPAGVAAACAAARHGRQHRAAGAAQPPGRPLDRRFGDLDRPDDRLGGPAGDPRLRRGVPGPPARRRGGRAAALRLGLARPGPRRALGAAHRRLPRRRHLVAHLRPGGDEVGGAGDAAGSGRRDPVPRLGRGPGGAGRRRPRRGVREQGRAARGAGARGGGRDRRRRPVPPRRRGQRRRHRRARHPPLHQHVLAVRRRGHAGLPDVAGGEAGRVLGVHADRAGADGPARPRLRLVAGRRGAVHGAALGGLLRPRR
jgi:hypothetical protein